MISRRGLLTKNCIEFFGYLFELECVWIQNDDFHKIEIS